VVVSPVEPSAYALKRGHELAQSPLAHSFVARLGIETRELFAFITDFPRLPEWMPLISRVNVDDSAASVPGQTGAVRVIQATLGKPTLERVVAFEPERMLAYSASDASLMGMYREHLGVLVTEPVGARESLLTWLTFCEAGTAPMRWLGPAMFRYVIGTSVKNLQRRWPSDSPASS
jgi:hypothetical protein